MIVKQFPMSKVIKLWTSNSIWFRRSKKLWDYIKTHNSRCRCNNHTEDNNLIEELYTTARLVQTNNSKPLNSSNTHSKTVGPANSNVCQRNQLTEVDLDRLQLLRRWWRISKMQWKMTSFRQKVTISIRSLSLADKTRTWSYSSHPPSRIGHDTLHNANNLWWRRLIRTQRPRITILSHSQTSRSRVKCQIWYRWVRACSMVKWLAISISVRSKRS